MCPAQSASAAAHEAHAAKPAGAAARSAFWASLGSLQTNPGAMEGSQNVSGARFGLCSPLGPPLLPQPLPAALLLAQVLLLPCLSLQVQEGGPHNEQGQDGSTDEERIKVGAGSWGAGWLGSVMNSCLVRRQPPAGGCSKRRPACTCRSPERHGGCDSSVQGWKAALD